MSEFNWRLKLKNETWEEGKVVTLVDGSYRIRCVVTCYAAGRQTAEFANGIHKIGAYAELMRPDGTWIYQGTNIVPVLPDSRLIMIVEQRPPQFRLPAQPRSIALFGDNRSIDLSTFGPYSSLEFPGGAVDETDKFDAGFLRELTEETEVEPQPVQLYLRRPPFFPQGSDIALEMSVGVVFLTRHRFSNFVNNDGGLHVLALTPDEIQMNIWAGNIRSGQAALHGWAFYQEVMNARRNENLLRAMKDSGYISVRPVTIK